MTAKSKTTFFQDLLKRLYKIFLLIFIGCILLTIGCNIYVDLFSATYIYTESSSIPMNEYGIILGTSRYTEAGDTNGYFSYRVAAATNLFFSGKIKRIICSGDNTSKYYNEPKTFSKALQKSGIPDSLISLDKNGINTNQSIQNFIHDYSSRSVTIITQKFHNERAVFLARKSGLDAVGYVADDIGFFDDIKTHIREWFAKVKAVLITL